MEKIEGLLEGLFSKARDTFFVNLIIGFILTNYKFLLVILYQEATPDFKTTAAIVEEAQKYLHLYPAIVYAIVITFMYPFFSMSVVKWKQITSNLRDKWIDKSFPSNKQYQRKISEINELKVKLSEDARNIGQTMAQECAKHFHSGIALFSCLTAAPNCQFSSGDYAIAIDISGILKLKPISNYRGNKGEIRYIYAKINDNLFLTSTVDQFSFQPDSFREGTSQFFILMTTRGVVMCSEKEWEKNYSSESQNIIFSLKKDQSKLYSTVMWNS